MIKPLNNHILYIFVLGCFASCTANKFLPEGEKYYNGSEISYDGRVDGQVKRGLNELFFPEPNLKLFGSRPFVWFYYIAGEPEKEKGFKYWMKHKLGSEPVFLSEVDIGQTATLLSEKLHSEGYFEHDIGRTIHEKKHSAIVEYHVTAGRPFVFKSIAYPRAKDSLSSATNSLQKEMPVQEGDRFRLETLASERTRLEKGLKNKGFYFMDDSYLIFDVDTSRGNRQVVALLRRKENFPEKAKNKYTIGDVYMIHSRTDSVKATADTIVVDSIHYYDPVDQFRPQAIIDKINLRPGKLYTQNDHDYTINKLINLPIFQYVNLSFEESAKENTLDATVHLIAARKKSLRVELQGALSSTDYLGPFLQATFQNRNLFGGAEILEVALTAGFETQIYRRQSGAATSYELGVNSSITFPKFISPLNISFENAQFVPNTKVRAGVERLNRVNYFTMSSVDMGFGYLWNETVMKKHELFPIDITVVNLTSSTQQFRDLLESNSFLRSSYEEQFILGSHYSYIYNTQAVKDRGTANDYFFNGNLDISGNLAHLLQSAIEAPPEDNYTILGAAYSQYAKVDFDFRFYHDLIEGNQIATRFIAGVGIPYGNSETLPYVKQFAIGGSSSIRAFRARSVGPGSYTFVPSDTLEEGIIIEQTADMKLELNLEYRFGIMGAIKGAAFVDMGNIWTLKNDPNRPGSQFKWNKFIDDVAIGTGLGIRYDADFFVIRLDVAFPIKDPADPVDERWIFQSGWDGSNLVYNIGIGYPF